MRKLVQGKILKSTNLDAKKEHLIEYANRHKTVFSQGTKKSDLYREDRIPMSIRITLHWYHLTTEL